LSGRLWFIGCGIQGQDGDGEERKVNWLHVVSPWCRKAILAQ
jgi:hypothetical protein